MYLRIHFILFIILPFFSFGETGTNSSLEIKEKRVKFFENKGQMTNMAGKRVPFVFFKAEAPGIDMYINKNMVFC